MNRSLALTAAFVALLAGRIAVAQPANAVPAGAPVAPAAAAKPSKPLPEPRKAVAEALAPQRFEFCHKPDYPLTPFEKQWCDLGAAADKAACPTLAEACKREAAAKQLDQEEPLTFKIPNLALPFRVVLWALLAVALAFLLFALIRHFLDHKVKETITIETATSEEEEKAAALARQVETDVQRLLERARAEAAAGDFRAAIGSAYAALLRRLEGTGVVRIEPDQTNGDYLGMVKRERPVIARRMAEVVDSVELAQFGRNEITREGFDGVWSRVTGMLSERIGVALVLFALLLASACGHPRADWEHSPSGRAGVISYLGKRGFTVRERLLSVAKIGDKIVEKNSESKPDDDKAGDGLKPPDKQVQQLVLLPGAQLRDDDWKAIKTWIDKGGKSLVVAGGRRELPSWIGVRVLDTPGLLSEIITPDATRKERLGALQVRVPGGNRVETSVAESHPLLRRKLSVYATERWLGYDGESEESEEEEEDQWSRIVVLADDYLFRNAGLLVADNAAALDAVLREGGTVIELAGDLTGLVSKSPIQSVQRGRLGPSLLQLAAFLVLLFVCKGARFGRPVITQRIERRDFAEHVGALGLHYARARAERVALGSLGAYVVERLRDRFGLHVDRSLSGLAEAVAARTGRPVGEVMRMFLEARDAGKGVPADKDARDLETAWQMCKLLEETGGTGGHKRIQGNV